MNYNELKNITYTKAYKNAFSDIPRLKHTEMLRKTNLKLYEYHIKSFNFKSLSLMKADILLFYVNTESIIIILMKINFIRDTNFSEFQYVICDERNLYANNYIRNNSSKCMLKITLITILMKMTF